MPGFAHRLSFVVEYAGIRNYGRLTAISNMMGMSVTGVRMLFTDDRPPAELVKFNSLVSGLVSEIKTATGKSIVEGQLSDHLLYNRVFPMSGIDGRNPGNAKATLDAYDIAHLGRVYRFLDVVSGECGVDIFKELAPGNLDDILNCVLKLFSDSKVKIDDPETHALVTSMVQLGVKGLLHR